MFGRSRFTSTLTVEQPAIFRERGGTTESGTLVLGRNSTFRAPQHLMNTGLLDYYRCPEDFVNVECNQHLSDDAGYFRFGKNTICYGRSAAGFRSNHAEGDLYDALEEVTISGSDVVCHLIRLRSSITFVLSVTRTPTATVR